ncbi:MAG TPA: ATP-binding protein [Euryarchaeota archaeon]|nr:ATP-binding protein [Euryarchaeota archaeon]
MKIENNITHSITIKANAIIEEAFSNLISNAIKYAPEGERIVIEGEEKDNFWRIKIIDFGDGIADENKKRIFDRFKRKAKRGVKGTGLGLAIAKRIIELHKGRIWIEDNPKNGAVFIVEIPKFHQNMSCRDFTLL